MSVPAVDELSGIRVAIVHEWLDSRTGSEKTFEQMAAAIPNADLFALSRRPGLELDLGGREVTTTWLDSEWLRRSRAATLPLMPLAFSGLRLSPYDLVITSSHAFANSVRVPRGALHLSYCHTPMRYVWLPELDRRSAVNLAVFRAPLRFVDRHNAHKVEAFAANSEEVRGRIGRFYGSDATVIYPPVDTDYFRPQARTGGDGVLIVSRLVGYKNIETALSAVHMLGVKAQVVGTGPLAGDLASKYASADIRFLGSVSDTDLRCLYSAADVVLFPAFEDFGIIPVEAQACGTPVVALNRGGTAETVRNGVTGQLVPEASADSFAQGVRGSLGLTGPETVEACRQNALRFAPDRFRSHIRAWAAEQVRLQQTGILGRG